MEFVVLFVTAAIVNNFVLHYFVGICPYVGVSKEVGAAASMGLAVIFVMTLAGIAGWLINNLVLMPLGLGILEYVSYVVVIASLVQLVELFLKKAIPALYRTLGIFLPLITSNCAILFLVLMLALEEYGFLESVFFSLGAGVGFTIAIVLMAGIREQLEQADIPRAFRGAAVTMAIAGIMALAFSGFAGLV